MKPIKFFMLLCLILAGTLLSYGQGVNKHGQLRVEGTQLKDQYGNAVVLRGVSFGWHNWWPRFYNPSAVKWLKEDWGCTVVRAAMGVEPGGGYLEKPEWSKEKIKAVVDGAINADIYVIIDWHSHNIKLKEAKEFFTEMAKTYGEKPHVIYEIFNEPDEDETWGDVKAYANEIISTIRAIDPDNIILVGTPRWDQDVDLAANDPIKGHQNLMYTLHFYAGTHKQWLRERADYALRKGLPLFISESAGMDASGNGPIDEKEWDNWIAWMEKNKLSWITWSISDKNETCSVLTSQAASEGGWEEKDLKPSGIKARTLLKKYAAK